MLLNIIIDKIQNKSMMMKMGMQLTIRGVRIKADDAHNLLIVTVMIVNRNDSNL